MAFRFRKKVILAKVESAYGTDAAPTGAANAILMRSVEITPLEAERVDREVVRPWRGNEKAFLTGVHIKIEGSVEWAPSGAVDTAPAWGPLMRACALAETVTPTTGPVTYDPVSMSDESVTIHFHMDGQKHAITGARGSVSLSLTAGQVPELRFQMTGLYVAPAAVADPTPTFTAWIAPKPATKANTPTVTVHGFAAILQELSLDLANEVNYVERVGSERVEIDNRSPSGAITIEAPALGTKDFFSLVKAETQGAVQLIHGSGNGGVVQVDAPNVQLLNPRYASLDGGAAGLQMDLHLVPGAAGDDEIKFTVK